MTFSCRTTHFSLSLRAPWSKTLSASFRLNKVFWYLDVPDWQYVNILNLCHMFTIIRQTFSHPEEDYRDTRCKINVNLVVILERLAFGRHQHLTELLNKEIKTYNSLKRKSLWHFFLEISINKEKIIGTGNFWQFFSNFYKCRLEVAGDVTSGVTAD